MMSEFMPGRTVEQLRENSFNQKNTQRLQHLETLTYEVTNGQQTFIDLLHQGSKAGISINTVARQLELGARTITRIYRMTDIPVLSQAESLKLSHQKPGFKAKRAAAATKARWKDQGQRERQAGVMAAINKKPGFMEKRFAMRTPKWKPEEFAEVNEFIPGRTVEQLRENSFSGRTADTLRYFENLTYEITNGQQTFIDLLYEGNKLGISLRAVALQISTTHTTLSRLYKIAGIPVLSQKEGLKVKWADDGYRKRQAAGTRAVLAERWKDEGFKERNAARIRAMNAEKWKDEDFRKRTLDTLRAARLNEANQGRYYLPTIYGVRLDIGYAHSAWEANFARILELSGREYLMHQPLPLADGTGYEIDFVTVDKRERLHLYEIMVHPFKDRIGWDKLIRAQEENPDLHITPVTQRLYTRLQRRFKKLVDSTPSLCGWETREDNLRTNPTKFGI